MLRILALVLFCGTLAAAEHPELGGPRTYATPSPDGQYLFVMIAPRPTDPNPAFNPEKEPSQKEIYAKYAESGSGLYRNDGSTTPLWKVDWYSYRVYPANDGVHLVRVHGDFPLSERFPASRRLPDEVVAEQVNAPALSFYENGKLMKVYAVRELVRDVEKLPHSLQHVLWSADGVFTQDGKLFGIMTQEPRQIYFDLATAKPVSDNPAGLGNAQLWVVRLSIAITGLTGIIILGGYYYLQRKQKLSSVKVQRSISQR